MTEITAVVALQASWTSGKDPLPKAMKNPVELSTPWREEWRRIYESHVARTHFMFWYLTATCVSKFQNSCETSGKNQVAQLIPLDISKLFGKSQPTCHFEELIQYLLGGSHLSLLNSLETTNRNQPPNHPQSSHSTNSTPAFFASWSWSWRFKGG